MERKEELKQKEVKILKCIKCGKEYIFDGKRGQSVNLGILFYFIPNDCYPQCFLYEILGWLENYISIF